MSTRGDGQWCLVTRARWLVDTSSLNAHSFRHGLRHLEKRHPITPATIGGTQSDSAANMKHRIDSPLPSHSSDSFPSPIRCRSKPQSQLGAKRQSRRLPSAGSMFSRSGGLPRVGLGAASCGSRTNEGNAVKSMRALINSGRRCHFRGLTPRQTRRRRGHGIKASLPQAHWRESWRRKLSRPQARTRPRCRARSTIAQANAWAALCAHLTASLLVTTRRKANT